MELAKCFRRRAASKASALPRASIPPHAANPPSLNRPPPVASPFFVLHFPVSSCFFFLPSYRRGLLLLLPGARGRHGSDHGGDPQGEGRPARDQHHPQLVRHAAERPEHARGGRVADAQGALPEHRVPVPAGKDILRVSYEYHTSILRASYEPRVRCTRRGPSSSSKSPTSRPSARRWTRSGARTSRSGRCT